MQKIKATFGILLALVIISLFGYLLYQPAAQSFGLPSCCELKCKFKGFPSGGCLRSDEVGKSDVHEKYGPCWNPIDKHCSVPGLCRCMCKNPIIDDFEY